MTYQGSVFQFFADLGIRKHSLMSHLDLSALTAAAEAGAPSAGDLKTFRAFLLPEASNLSLQVAFSRPLVTLFTCLRVLSTWSTHFVKGITQSTRRYLAEAPQATRDRAIAHVPLYSSPPTTVCLSLSSRTLTHAHLVITSPTGSC